MVMIETRNRDRQQTLADIDALIEQARAKGMHAVEWRIGFFCARDLMATHPDWARLRRTKGAWTPICHVADGDRVVPLSVVELEDRIVLVAAREDKRTGGLVLEEFTVDRRASQI